MVAKTIIYELRIDHTNKFFWSLARIRAALKKLPEETQFKSYGGVKLSRTQALCTRWWKEELDKWGMASFICRYDNECKSIDILNHEVN